MSDISISERRLSAALDRIGQYLDRGGVGHGPAGSDLRAELDAAHARIAELTDRMPHPAADGAGVGDMAEHAARLAAANDSLSAANRALIAAMAGEDDRIEAVSLALEAEIESLRAARAAEAAQLAALLAEVEQLLGDDRDHSDARATDDPDRDSSDTEKGGI
ncbi:hypothetical protein [Paracoccus subflavus]|uniref:hypothetical protein n=1 Tax=Paracoccus subflavus TaxID=2528244 RepID=UPI001B8B1C85|nr:hypothetical protein [Paracoccus subflavus]